MFPSFLRLPSRSSSPAPPPPVVVLPFPPSVLPAGSLSLSFPRLVSSSQPSLPSLLPFVPGPRPVDQASDRPLSLPLPPHVRVYIRGVLDRSFVPFFFDNLPCIVVEPSFLAGKPCPDPDFHDHQCDPCPNPDAHKHVCPEPSPDLFAASLAAVDALRFQSEHVCPVPKFPDSHTCPVLVPPHFPDSHVCPVPRFRDDHVCPRPPAPRFPDSHMCPTSKFADDHVCVPASPSVSKASLGPSDELKLFYELMCLTCDAYEKPRDKPVPIRGAYPSRFHGVWRLSTDGTLLFKRNGESRELNLYRSTTFPFDAANPRPSYYLLLSSA
jgi:hypothetical protein